LKNKIDTENDLYESIARMIAGIFYNGSKPGIHYSMTKELYINVTLKGWKATARGIAEMVRKFDKENKDVKH
jgi:hypothetical protein